MDFLKAKPLLLVSAFFAVVSSTPTFAQSVSSGSVNGISYSVIGGNNQSISARDGGIEIISDDATILLLPDSLTVNGESRAVENAQEVVVDRSTGGLEIRLDGDAVFGLNEAETLEARVADGDIQAMNDLSILLFDGTGVGQDLSRAEALLRQAAEGGNPQAQSNLAGRLADGIDVTENLEEAFLWAVRAADQGNAIAQTLAGRMLAYGAGTQKDITGAQAYLEAALEQGYGDAAAELGFLYGAGDDVVRDYAKAVGYYQRGLELGNARSAFNLAVVSLETNGSAVAVLDGLAALDMAVSLGWSNNVDTVRTRLTALLDTPDERYFYADGDTPVGPMTIQELRAFFTDGTINAQTLAWEGGTENWVPVAQIQNFKNDN